MEPKQPWWRSDLSEELTIIALLAIAICCIVVLGVDGKEAVSAIGGGLVGYLSRGNNPS